MSPHRSAPDLENDDASKAILATTQQMPVVGPWTASTARTYTEKTSKFNTNTGPSGYVNIMKTIIDDGTISNMT